MKNVMTQTNPKINYNFASPRQQGKPSYNHDYLVRCTVCRMKYDRVQLFSLNHRMVCKFCIRSLGTKGLSDV